MTTMRPISGSSKRRAKCSISIGEKIKAEILGEAPLKEPPAPETNA